MVFLFSLQKHRDGQL